MSDDGVAFDSQWSPAARAQLELAGRDLLDAVGAHLALLAHATDSTPAAEIREADAALRCAAAEYAAAQFDLTGGFGPLAELESWTDEDQDDEARSEPVAYVTVLQRADYAVVDEAAVLAAGRAAYLRTRPGEPEESAAAVASVGAALYEWAHRDGWESLAELPGLAPIGGIAQVVGLEEAPEIQEALGEAAPSDPFAVSGGLLFTAVDRYS